MKVIVIARTEGDYGIVDTVYASLEALYFEVDKTGMHKDYGFKEVGQLIDAGLIEIIHTEVIE